MIEIKDTIESSDVYKKYLTKSNSLENCFEAVIFGLDEELGE